MTPAYHFQIDTLKELESRSIGNHNLLNASGGSVEEVNRTPLQPASTKGTLPNAMGMFPSKKTLHLSWSH